MTDSESEYSSDYMTTRSGLKLKYMRIGPRKIVPLDHTPMKNPVIMEKLKIFSNRKSKWMSFSVLLLLLLVKLFLYLNQESIRENEYANNWEVIVTTIYKINRVDRHQNEVLIPDALSTISFG